MDATLVIDAKDPALATAAGSPTPAALILTDGSTLPAVSKAALSAIWEGADVYAVGTGAQDAISGGWPGKSSKTTVTPLSTGGGAGTVALAEALAGSPRWAVLADPSSPVDVAIAAGLAHAYGAQLVLAGSSGVDNATRDWLIESAGSIDTVLVVGAGVPAEVASAVGQAVSGPLGPLS